MLDRLENFWCKWMHDSAMWPMHGRYECRTCGRVHAVRWAAENDREPAASHRSGVWKFAGASK